MARIFILAGNRAEFIDYCRWNGLSPLESRGETIFVDEGYRLRSQTVFPGDEVVYHGTWRSRSGARHMLNDIQLMMRRSVYL